MTTYSVVHFLGDNSVEPVPSFWFKKNGTCAWPKNGAFVKKFVERKSIPNEIEFNFLKARLLKRNIGSFFEANALAEKGCIQTDLSDNENDKSKRKLKAKKANQTYSDCPEYSESDNEGSKIIIKSNYKLGSTDDDCCSFSPKKLKSTSNNKFKENGWSASPRKIKTLNNLANNSKPLVVKQLTYDDDDDDDDNDDNIFKNSAITNLKQKDVKNSTTKLSNSITPKSNSEISASTPTEFTDKDFQKDVLHRLTFIKHELRRIINNQMDISQRIEALETRKENNYNIIDGTNNFNSLNDITDCSIPLDNKIDLDIFEDKISGDNLFRTNLVNELSFIGGKHVKAMIKRIMYKVFTDELLKDFSYTGKKGKNKFSTLAICSVIFEAVKKQNKFKHTSQNDMEEIIKYTLAQAPFNIKRSQNIKF